MARPKKQDHEKKGSPMGFRLTPEDKEFLLFVGNGSVQAGIDWLVKIARLNALL